MELLNEKVINSDEFLLVKSIFKNNYKNLNSIISYENFKKTIILFVEKIMNTYLEDTSFNNDKCKCLIENLNSNICGKINRNSNTITINDIIIKNIYNGNICDMAIIFHELNHFKYKYDILLGKINVDLARILKENLLATTDENIVQNFKNLPYNNYYKCNYSLFSEEKLAEINSINDLLLFLKKLNIKISTYQKEKLLNSIKNNTIQYNNYLRDFRFDLNFNNYFLDFEEAFDVSIKYNPSWVEIPLLSIEYYVDDCGNVIKRTKEELEEKLKKETNTDVIEYIKNLITPSGDKRLFKYDFNLNNSYRLEEMLNYKENRNYSNFKR